MTKRTVVTAPSLLLTAGAVALAVTIEDTVARALLTLVASLGGVALAGRLAVLADVRCGAAPPSGAHDAAPVVIADRRRPTIDRDTGLCSAWYFRLRLEDEIARAARYGTRFTVLNIARDEAPPFLTLAPLLHKHLRTVDYAADLGNALAVVLPNTTRAGAQVVVERMRAERANISISVAEYPIDAETPAKLLGEHDWQTSPEHVDEAA
jgi:GGDEF domain-containing protein